uniref:Uncharacterized protein n=1 Tax=Glossina pallidipes TaxID=7398 RepID=A0A1A9Z0E3_GLOPL
MKFVEQRGAPSFPLWELVTGYKYLNNYHKFTFCQTALELNIQLLLSTHLEIQLILNRGNELMPGKSSMSPVSKLKHAPCQGQRIRPSPKTPFASGALAWGHKLPKAYTAMVLCNLIIANDSKFIANTIDGRIGDVTAYRCAMTRYDDLENLCNDLDRMQRAIKDAEQIITLMKEEIVLKKLDKAEALYGRNSNIDDTQRRVAVACWDVRI